MLRNQRRFKPLGDRRQPFEMRLIERAGRADRQADAVQREGIALADGVEPAMRRAARAHVVFRVDFEKPKLWRRVDDRLEMLRLETDAHIRRGEAPLETTIRVGHWGFSKSRFARNVF